MEFELLFGPEDVQAARPGTEALAEDLRLDLLLDAMAGDDRRMADACRRVLLHPLTDRKAIAQRCAVRRDAVTHPRLLGAWLTSARDALDGAARYAEFQKPRYDRIISNQKKLLTEIKIARLYLQCLRRIRAAAAAETGTFASPAVRAFLEVIRVRFGEETLARMEARLDTLDGLKRSDDLTLGAVVGGGLRPASAVLHGLAANARDRKLQARRQETAIPLSSVALVRNAEDIVQNAVLPLFRTAADFNREMRNFLEKLSFQLCFYLGCARLEDRLRAVGVPLCEPRIDPACGGIESDALINAGLALQEKSAPAGNGVRFAGKRLVLITGVNQGGKTTFLRSVGQAQLMAQCGLFVTAERYVCPPYEGVYSHFPSGEDTARGMGLLDVELNKLSGIVDCVGPHSLLLLNETFQTTMPSDAKYLADRAVRALTDCGVTVVFVTHLYAYAAGQYAARPDGVLFLRADRENGYRLREGEPRASAEGEALYREVLNG